MLIGKTIKLAALGTIAGGALLFGACGGDDGGGGSDEDFISAICKAGADFFADLEEVDTEETDPSKLMESFAEPFDKFANAVEDANPPEDLETWHADAVKSLKDIVAKMEDGDVKALDSLGDSPFPEPPAGTQERLNAIAEDNEDCQEADLGFGE